MKGNVIIVILFATFMIFFNTQLIKMDVKIMKAYDWLIRRSEKVEVESDHQENYIEQIKTLCGDLCDFKKEITPGEFMGSVTAKVDCDSLFAIDLLNMPSGITPPKLSQTDQIYQEYLLHGGQVEAKEYYFDNANMGGGRMVPTNFSKIFVENYISKFLASRTLAVDQYYKGASRLVEKAAEVVNVTGKIILVIGSQDPWLEAVLLSRNASKIVTLEYGWFISEHPSWEFIRPTEFHQRYLDGTLDKFDAVFTYSSMEHSGLGRYGDSLNPWADIITIAQAWCVSKPGAKLAIGVPTNVNGRDRIDFNAHRVYGPILYPYMVTNWRFIWPVKDEQRMNPGSSETYQPVFIFSKQ